MNFDIDTLSAAPATTHDVIVGKNEDGTPVGFRVVGMASEQFRAAERAINILNIQEASKRKVAVDPTTVEGATVVADGAEQRRKVMVDHCTVGWFGFRKGDAEAPFTPQNLQAVLAARPHWGRLISTAIENDANFGEG